MKLVFSITLCMLFCLSACSSLPPLVPLSPAENQSKRCGIPFVAEKRQFVHAISTVLPGGKYGQVTGVTTVNPGRQSVHAVILTLEGLVLFEGIIDGGRINIRRAFPPFSSIAFAEGLMNDVRLIFLPPTGRLKMIGKSDRHGFVCRYRNPDDSFIDVRVRNGSDWSLVLYDSGFHPKRRVTARMDTTAQVPAKKTTPPFIELTANGAFGYSLDLQLIEEAGF